MSETVTAIILPDDMDHLNQHEEPFWFVANLEARGARVVTLTEVERIGGVPMPDNIYRMEGGEDHE